jgi:hypothetical protein
VLAGRSKQDRPFGRAELEALMDEVFGSEVHAQRLASLTDGVDGVLHAASLGGERSDRVWPLLWAWRHAIKPGNRWLSNPKLSMEQVFGGWVPFVVGERWEIAVNFDWTELADADQCTVILGRQREHGRSTPLVWKTVTRSELKDQRNDHEDHRLVALASVVLQHVRVTVVADRGCADSQLYSFLTEELGFGYISRFRGVVYVEDAAGERSKAKQWLGTAGRRRVFRHARVTAQRHRVPVVVWVQDKAMQEPRCLVSSRQDLTGIEIKVTYGWRFTVEETFRDGQNPRFGLGLKQTVIEHHDR